MEQPNGVLGWGIAQWGRSMLVLVLAGAVLLGSGATPARAHPGTDVYRPADVPTENGPSQPDHLAAALYQKYHRSPGVVPAGANDFDCVPDAGYPRPVVLAHGTDSSAYSDWSAIGTQLIDAGICVFALNYGGAPGAQTYGTEDMRVSAWQVGDFVDHVLDSTGADQVDLVGFSQGANVTRYYMNKLGGAPKVRQWVGLASPTYGGVLYGLTPIAQMIPGALDAFARVTSPAVVQQAQGSPFMLELNAGGDTVPGPRYVTVGSRVDEMIQPFGNIALRGQGAENIVLQDLCPENLTGHFHMVYDPFVQELLLGILDPARAAEPTCRPVALGTEIPEVIIAGHS